jgi:ADP-ribose pyrophosphatase YjhB (NUDIX family)
VDALRREVAEETGLRVASSELFGVFSDPSRIVRYADGNTYRVVTAGYELISTHRPIIELYLSGESPPFVD